MATSEAVPAGERKHVTAVFLDIIDFSTVASSVDPEDLQTWLEQYYKTSGEIIEANGGEVTEYLGDGIVAMFGLSRADELSALKAVRAAQQAVDHFAAQDGGPIRAIELRAGVASGEVVVRADMSNNWPRITGTVTTLAQRVQEAAHPNTVVMSQSTAQLLRGQIPVETLPDRVLKGFSESQTLFRAQTAPARQPDAKKGIVGRDGELAAIAAAEGPVLVLGEAGYGKSALARAVAATAERRQFFLADGVNTGSSYHPFKEWLLYRLGKSDPAFGDLGARFPQLTDRACRCLALILGMPEGQVLLTEVSNTGLQGQIQTALWHAVRMDDSAALLVFEDLHWFDSASLGVLGHMLDVQDGAPHRIIMTSRPSPSADSLAERAQVKTLALDPLSSDGALDLLDDLSGGELTPELRETLLERAAGIPLFIEQLYLRGSTTGQDHVPDTLMGLLAERIDEAGAMKPLLQKVSAIGRSFTLEMIEAIAPEFDRPSASLNALVKAGVLDRRSEVEWSFSHALLRDAAYQSILRKTRRDLHGTICDLLIHRFPQVTARDPAILAEHQSKAGRLTESVQSFLAASKWALLQGAFTDAEGHARHALDLCQAPEMAPKRPDLEIECYTAIGSVVMQYAGFTAPPVEEAFDQVHQIARTRALPGQESSAALFGSFSFAIMAADQRKSDEFQDLLIDLSKRGTDDATGTEVQLAALAAQNCSGFYKGNFDHQFQKIAQIRGIYRAEKHAMMITRYGMDIFAAAQMFEAPARAITGTTDRVTDLVAETDAHQAVLNIPVMQPYALIWGAVPLWYLGAGDAARARLAEGLAVAQDQQAEFWQLTGAAWHHVMNAPGGAPDPAFLKSFGQVIATHDAVGVNIGAPYFRAHFAAQLAAAGRMEEAYAAGSKSVAQSRAHSLHVWYPEILRLHARTCDALGHGDEARTCRTLARETAARQGAALWTLRLLLDQAAAGQLEAEPLAQAVARFDPGTVVPEVEEGRALLSRA